MADDIVTRLRQVTAKPLSLVFDPPPHPLCKEAADEIERLRAQIERLIPFVRLIADAEPYKTLQFDPDDVLWDQVHPTVQEAADARAAVAAYEAPRKEGDRD